MEVRTEPNKMLSAVLDPAPQPAEVAKLTGQKQLAAYWRRPFQLLADRRINKLPSNIRGETFCVFEGTLSRECCLFIPQSDSFAKRREIAGDPPRPIPQPKAAACCLNHR